MKACRSCVSYAQPTESDDVHAVHECCIRGNWIEHSDLSPDVPELASCSKVARDDFIPSTGIVPVPSANILPGCALVQQVGHGSGVALGPVAAAQLRTAALLRVLGRQVVPQSLQAAAFILHSNMSPRNLAEASCGGGLGNQSRVARYHVWACVLRIAGPECLCYAT